MQKFCRLCENSEFAEKWLVATEFSRFGEPVMNENRQKSAVTRQLMLGRASIHTVCLINAHAPKVAQVTDRPAIAASFVRRAKIP